jgi:hypothetical protein
VTVVNSTIDPICANSNDPSICYTCQSIGIILVIAPLFFIPLWAKKVDVREVDNNSSAMQQNPLTSTFEL